MQALNTGGIDTSVMVNVPESVMRGAADKDLVPYGQLKRSNRRYTFPKTFSFELLSFFLLVVLLDRRTKTHKDTRGGSWHDGG